MEEDNPDRQLDLADRMMVDGFIDEAAPVYMNVLSKVSPSQSPVTYSRAKLGLMRTWLNDLTRWRGKSDESTWKDQCISIIDGLMEARTAAQIAGLTH